MKTIDQLDVANKVVFVRADLNVPLQDGAVADDTRIKSALNTVNELCSREAKVILASHLGRPKGVRKEEFSLAPVKAHIEKLLGREIYFAQDCIGDEVDSLVSKLSSGEILLLENLRFHKAETDNDKGFSESLGKLADVYVNDAFGTAHRAHASTAGITAFVSEKAAGRTLEKEMNYFEKAISNPQKPFAAIFGGAKISTKLAAIKNVGETADKILIGGAMANTFFAADGLEVGKSLIEPDLVPTALEIRKKLEALGCELVLPVDVIVAAKLESGQQTQVVNVDSIPSDMMALDIGPRSVELFNDSLQNCSTIVWNGPMGAFETSEFSAGTFAIVDTLVDSDALTIVGGGDTDLALHQKHALDKVSYVSTGGGAFLELLEGKILPGVAALES